MSHAYKDRLDQIETQLALMRTALEQRRLEDVFKVLEKCCTIIKGKRYLQ